MTADASGALAAALRYAALGLRVLPVWNRGKEPIGDLVPHGCHDATTDEATIRAWCAARPDAGVAIATGAASRVWVVDVDDEERWRALLDDHDAREPTTLQARTGGGGRHLYFSWPDSGLVTNSKGKLRMRAGFDVRGEGGYVVAAPSLHASGRRYEWLDVDAEIDDLRSAIQHAPAWLLDLLCDERPAGAPVERGVTEPAWNELPAHEVARIRGALEFLDADCERDEWMRVGMALKSTGADQQAFALWDEWSKTAKKPDNYSAQECRRQWRSLRETLSGAREITLGTLYYMAKKAGWVDQPAPATAAAADSEPPSAARPWPAPLGEVALYGLAGELVAEVEPFTEADPVALLVHFLAAYGIALNKGPHLRVGATKHCGNLFFGVVGATASGRKGTAWSVVREVFRCAEPIAEPGVGNLPIGPAREAGFMARVQGGLATGEGLIHCVRDPKWQNQPVKNRGHTMGREDVLVDEGVRDKRLLVVEPELARVFGVMRREGATLSQILREAWDGETLRVMAKSVGEVATHPHVGLVGHITQDELLNVLEDVEAANGFGNRFIWICCRRSKLLPDAPAVPRDLLAHYGEQVRRSLDRARLLGEVRLAPAARSRWHSEYRRLSEDRPGLLGSLLARGSTIPLRLALVFACLDGAGEVDLMHLEAALELWRYAEDSAAWIFGDRLGDPVAERILQALREHPDGRTRTQVSHLLGRNVSAARMNRAIEVLKRVGVEEIPGAPDGLRGRPATKLRLRTSVH